MSATPGNDLAEMMKQVADDDFLGADDFLESTIFWVRKLKLFLFGPKIFVIGHLGFDHFGFNLLGFGHLEFSHHGFCNPKKIQDG